MSGDKLTPLLQTTLAVTVTVFESVKPDRMLTGSSNQADNMSDVNVFGSSACVSAPLSFTQTHTDATVEGIDDLIALADGLRNAAMYMAAARRLSAQDVPSASLSVFAIDKAMEELNLVRFALIRICEYVVLDDVN